MPLYRSKLDGGRRLYVNPARRLRGLQLCVDADDLRGGGDLDLQRRGGLHRAEMFGTTITVAFMGAMTENIYSDSGVRISATVKFTL